MFTGIVEDLGSIVAIKSHSGLGSDNYNVISISTGMDDTNFTKGASIAVDGVCLTVEKFDSSTKTFTVTAVEETLKKTTISQFITGKRVNLESPIALSTKLSGHFVYGHVDAIAEVKKSGNELMVQVPLSLKKYLASKGSVCINGVSLTIVDLNDDMLSVAIIPETLSQTNLGLIQIGEFVNIEVDMIARYLEQLIINK